MDATTTTPTGPSHEEDRDARLERLFAAVSTVTLAEAAAKLGREDGGEHFDLFDAIASHMPNVRTALLEAIEIAGTSA